MIARCDDHFSSIFREVCLATSRRTVIKCFCQSTSSHFKTVLVQTLEKSGVKVRGQWVYLYRAVDDEGRTVDFLLSKRRDVAAAQRFFFRAARQHGSPRVITLDGYAASHRAVTKLKEIGTLAHRVRIRSSKYRIMWSSKITVE
jgi:transposase-like protein